MEEFSTNDILAILKQRKRYFFTTAGVVLLLSLLFVWHWSNYRSSATVQIEQSAVASKISKPDENSDVDLADQRINQIQQQVTSVESLSEIITKFNLYPGSVDSTPMAELTEKMRNKIKVNFISGTIANPAAAMKQTAEQLSAIAFEISFDYPNPTDAKNVTDELVTRFMDEDLKKRRTQAKETSSFLEGQITALEANIADQEKSMAEFRAKNGESGPAALMFNQQAAANNNLSLQNLEAQINTNEGTMGVLRAQLATTDPYSRMISDGQVLTTPTAQLKALQSQYATLTSQYGPNHPDVVKVRRQMNALKAQIGSDGKDGKADTGDNDQLRARITDMETNIAAAEETKGEDDPDLKSMKSQLVKLKEKLAATPEKTEAADDDTIKKDADNPAYMQLVTQLRTAEEQHKSLVTQRDALVEQRNKYDQMIASNPSAEKEMAKLSRDYENSQLRYRELKERKMSADMAEQLEADRKGQRLTVIIPPTLPESTTPSRKILLAATLVVSIITGLCSVIMAEILHQSVHGPNHLSRLVGAAPLAVIPHIRTEQERTHLLRTIILAIITIMEIAKIGFLIAIAAPAGRAYRKIASARAKKS